MEIDQFDILERKINNLIDKNASLVKEKNSLEERCRQKEKEAVELTEQLNSEKTIMEQISKKVESLIKKLDEIE